MILYVGRLHVITRERRKTAVATPAFVIGIVLATSGKILVVAINKEIKEAVILLKD